MATKVDRTASMLCRRSGCSSEELAQRVIAAENALRSFLGWYDRRYPGGEGSALPGLTLWGIAEDARAALKGER